MRLKAFTAISFTLAGVVVATAWPSGAQLPQSPAEMTATETTDSLPVKSESEILTDSAAAVYRHVQEVQYDGEVEGVLYPMVFDSNSLAVEALVKSDTPELKRRNRSIVADLNPTLMQGVLYYSTAGDQANTLKFARAMIDAQLMPEMSEVKFNRDLSVFPSIVYNAAYAATNAGDLKDAQKYLDLYLQTGTQHLRENVTLYMGQTCIQNGDYSKAFLVLNQGINEYPTNEKILMLAIQCCIDGGFEEHMGPLLEKAILLNPDDERLLFAQAGLLEKEHDWQQALNLYRKIEEIHPGTLQNNQGIARCLYNLGAQYYNESIMEHDDKISARSRRQSKAFFVSAVDALEKVLATTPADMRYLRSLAHTFAAIGEMANLEEINRRIIAYGGAPIKGTDMPAPMGRPGTDNSAQVKKEVEVPTYAQFAKPYIEDRIAQWAVQGEFEKLEDYEKRITGGGAEEYYNLMKSEAEKAYLDKYARKLLLSDLKRSDYDVENETYLITTPYGESIIKVPMKNNEAQAFKAGWEVAQIRAPKFIIRDDKVALAEITYVVNNRKYTWKASDANTYEVPDVYVNVNDVLASVVAKSGKGNASRRGSSNSTAKHIWVESDVDQDIVRTNRRAENVFALLVANENYNNAGSVFGALHDGYTMREYCEKTLGVPEENVVLVNNATRNMLIDELDRIGTRVRSRGSDAEVIFYYAGHGLPDDASKEAFMMPVDANPRNMATLLPMKDVYGKLGNMGAESVAVFIDACFSGTGRDGLAVNESRGVELKHQEVAPEGNMFVLSAASGQQTAMPYKEKGHGLFTYFLLKKLQESKGNATLQEISEYVKKNVNSTSINNKNIDKEQTPTVALSGNMTKEWTKKRLK